MISKTILHEKIKTSREFLCMSQIDLAEETGLSRATVQRLETDPNWNWKLATAYRVFSTLNLSIDNVVEEGKVLYYLDNGNDYRDQHNDEYIFYPDGVLCSFKNNDSHDFTGDYSFMYEQGFEDGVQSYQQYLAYAAPTDDTFEDYEQRLEEATYES